MIDYEKMAAQAKSFAAARAKAVAEGKDPDSFNPPAPAEEPSGRASQIT